jgi:hypothetical protein
MVRRRSVSATGLVHRITRVFCSPFKIAETVEIQALT